jgi:DNA-binding NtrC family response regulator
MIKDAPALPNTVVVIEDDDLLRSLMVDAVEELGYDVAQFSNADDGLIYTLRAGNSLALALTDLTLPGQINGIEFADMLHQRYPALPVIITTGYLDADKHLPDWITFLPKPWTMEHLLKTVRALCA